MSSLSAGVSFQFRASRARAASQQFRAPIKAWVEAYDDESFWKQQLDFHNLKVKVLAISDHDDATANGKGQIKSLVNSGKIELCKEQVICVDSDYDYLLDLENDFYNSEYCFQTYTHSIECHIWDPKDICKYACRAAGYQIDYNLEQDVIAWSKYVYSWFLSLLAADTHDDKERFAAQINDALKLINIENSVFPESSDILISEEFHGQLKIKGLTESNVHLFYRGHDLEERFSALAVDIRDKALFSRKAHISEQFGNDGKIGEFMSKKLCAKSLIIGRENYTPNICYDLLMADLTNFANMH